MAACYSADPTTKKRLPMNDTIERFMTESVFTISSERTLQEAHEMMRMHHIRHLPVLHGGALVGMVTERDLNLVETMRSVDPQTARVEDAMTEDVFAVSPGTKLAEVARRMAKDKLGSAVVLDGRKVVGIFTDIDALRALEFLLSTPAVMQALEQMLSSSAQVSPS